MSDPFGFEAEYDQRAERYWARRTFLDTVRRVVPEVLGSLRDDVLPVFREYEERPDYLVLPGHDYPPQLYLEKEPATRAALDAWGRRWGLSEPWILDTAAATLRSWAQTNWTPEKDSPEGMVIGNWPHGPAARLNWYLGYRATFPRVEPPEPPPLQVNPFEPTLGRWSHYAAYAQDELDRWLERYKARVERWAELHGLEPANQGPQRARIVDSRTVYYEWLALWWVKPLTHSEIARQYKAPERHNGILTEKVVARHCRRLADLIGLDRTKRKRRRPR